MIRKLGPLALLLLLVGVFAVGCGDDDKSDSSNDAPAATTSVADDTATAGTATEEAGEVDTSDETLAVSIKACEDSIDTNPQVAADLKDDLKAVCESIRSSDPEEMRRITREVCETIVEKSVPEGDLRDQALQTCSAGG